MTDGRLAKDALGGKNAHDPIQRLDVTIRFPRQIVHAPLSGGQAIGNVEICRDPQRLRDNEAKA